MMRTNSLKSPVLIYDDQCPLCVRFKMALERSPMRHPLEFLSLHDKDLFIKYPQLKSEQLEQEVHLITEDQTILKGPEVIEYLIHNLPWSKPFVWLLDNNRGKQAISYFYQKTNELREKLKQQCSGCS